MIFRKRRIENKGRAGVRDTALATSGYHLAGRPVYNYGSTPRIQAKTLGASE